MAIFKVLAFAASCVGLVAAFSSPPELDEFNGLKISTGISTQLEGIFKLPRKFQKQQIQNLFLHQQEQWNKQMEKAQEQIDKLVNQTNFLSGELRSVTDEKKSMEDELSLGISRAMIEDFENRYGSAANKTLAKLLHIRIREVRWRYILQNRTDEPRVRMILFKLEELKAKVTTPKNAEEFAKCVADGYGELCEEIHSRLLKRAKGLPITTGFLMDPCAGMAVDIIYGVYNFKNILKVHNCSVSNE